MKSKKTVGKTLSKTSKTPSKVKKLPKSSSSFSKKWMLICAVIFGVIGVATLLYSFAATNTVKYFGELTAVKPTAVYKLTMGDGTMHVDFSNNTADVLLTITKKSGAIVGSIKSRGSTDIGLDAKVTSGTYFFTLTTRAAFTGSKGYKINIAYPVKEIVTPVDATPPTTILSAPLDQTVVSGTTNLAAITSDASGVSKVEFFVNNTFVGSDLTSPYSTPWNSTTVSNGSVTISAKSYDVVGNVGEASGAVTVLNPTSPPARRPLIGVSGGTTVPGAADRIFYQTNTSVAQRTAGAPRVHVSWKVLGDTPLTDAQFIAVVRNLHDGDKVEYEHETDAKYRKDGNAGNLAARLAAKNYLYDQVVRLRSSGQIPQLDVVNTLTSYAFESRLFGDVSRYYARADVIGADLDGGAFPHDYSETSRLGNIVSYANDHYHGRWTVPEFGWSDDPANARMTEITRQIAGIATYATHPEEIQYHNNPNFGATLNATELIQMKAIVDQYNLSL